MLLSFLQNVYVYMEMPQDAIERLQVPALNTLAWQFLFMPTLITCQKNCQFIVLC